MAEEEARLPSAPAERKKSSGILKYIIIIVIILVALWYFAPDTFANLVSFVQNLVSP